MYLPKFGSAFAAGHRYLAGPRRMPVYQFSQRARLDLIEIAEYTLETWGIDQANSYIDSLYDCFALLTMSPRIGRPCDKIRRGYRRIEHEKHAVFYRIEGDGVFISRILHHAMLPSRHMMDDS
jgi:toxin ParE1/3/4